MKFVPSAVTRMIGRQSLVLQKNSPHILFVGGVVGVGATVVMACRATLKLDEVLSDIHEEVEKAKDVRATYPDIYSEDDRKKDLAIIYIQGASKIAKLYGPAFILGVTSIAALAGSHNILSKRNAGLTAAYAALDKGFREYRSRVVSELGEDKDREFRYGTEEVEVVTKKKDGGDKTEVVKKAKYTPGGSIYARFFDEDNPNWSPQGEYNHLFLRVQQRNATDMLRARGHLFLNEVYDLLGLERTPAGSQVGWLFDHDAAGDGYVDLGIWEDESMERLHNFVTGAEGGIWLDFNVDGVIWDKI